jgi:hypothetical protein
MFARRTYRAAIAAILLYLLLIPDVSYPQDTCSLRNLAVSASAIYLPYESAFCDQEEEAAPLAQRILLAKESCETLPRAGWTNGICVRADSSATACKNDEERIQIQLLAMGKRGATIARIREQVLEILQDRNACAAWYQEVDADPAATFRSLKFVLDEKGPPFVQSTRVGRDGLRFKHPYVASAFQNAGPNSTIQLNANGAFFNHSSAVFEESPNGGPARPEGMRTLRVDYYAGDTTEAQLTAMLHELGHIVGRIPEDSDSFDGLSARNTAEVLRYCRPEIQAMARKNRH